jgi:riboflavin kinase/FMN adenylyltransferase
MSATPAGIRVVGEVVHGRHRGRTLGFPTANLWPAPGEALPEPGVWAGWALDRPAAVNVGVAPSFADGRDLLVEVHVLDFHGDLYGMDLEVELLERLGPERRFASREELRGQLARHVQATRRVAARRGLLGAA